MNRLQEWLSTFFFLGYSPFASGTAGTLGAVALAGFMLLLPLSISYGIVSMGLVLLFLVLGIPLGHWAEVRYGKKDPGPFVLDEVMGFFVPLCIFIDHRPGWDEIAVAFFLFRLFDVIKPPPARRIESLPGGWGIMLDDAVAGIYTLMGAWVYHSIRMDLPFGS